MLVEICTVAICWIITASCSQCIEPRETGTNFSITVTQDVTVEAGRCIPISCKFTYPGNITEYVRRVWFKGDALTPVFEKDAEVCGVVWQSLRGPERSCSFFLEDQQEGESEYRFKLTWGGDQMYVFPERVRVSVSALTQKKPTVETPPLTEGERATLTCKVYSLKLNDLCPQRLEEDFVGIDWRGTENLGMYWGIMEPSTAENTFSVNKLYFTPKSEHHNINLTCMGIYKKANITVEKTVTLTVKYRPKFLNGSVCVVQAEVLTCVCVSQGVPLPVIAWPMLGVYISYSVIVSRSAQTVTSTITMSASEYKNSSMECVSRNVIGQTEMEFPVLHQAEGSLTHIPGSEKRDVAVFPWIIVGLSLSLNVALLVYLTSACKCKKGGQKRAKEEDSTYISLDKADVSPEYDIISPNPH
ncbi:sialic acid-binding Ig-like lectin 9 isoform X1 [Oncorhynchus mykiss]|nr:sialic acid-binding Ig-like lectin 9 isoform X1 [Oncorhynchus mykiss]XP_036829579.1 sialic acid-binding Ig-like lectin 9 isoform X1 [Oncorhynchus mykiss]